MFAYDKIFYSVQNRIENKKNFPITRKFLFIIKKVISHVNKKSNLSTIHNLQNDK